MQHRKEERRAREASRTSTEQRIDAELGVPMNLFELLKGDISNYPLQMIYYLQLHHQLWGLFPAVRNAIRREQREMVFSTDVKLVIDLWRTLEPRDSRLASHIAYVNQEIGIAYLLKEDLPGREESTPIKLLSREKFTQLQKSEGAPFCWAPGLLGPTVSAEHFMRLIEQAAKEHRVAA